MTQTRKEKVYRNICIGNKFIFGHLLNFARKEILWFEKTLQRWMFGKSVSINVWLDLEKQLK